MKFHYGLALAALLPAAAAPAAVVDVSQTTIARAIDPPDFGQSFTAGRAADLTAVRLSMSTGFGGSSVTLRVHEFDRTTLMLSPTILGTGRLLEAQLSTEPAWREVALATPVPLTAGRTYAFTLQADDPGGDAGWNNYGVSFADVYPGGEFFYGLSGTVHATANVGDLAFQTVVVPEPAVAVSAVAAAGLLALRRRRATLR